MRDFNSAIARLVSRYYFVKGRRAVWARRYAYQILPRDADVENWYLYLVLNPVSSGIVDCVAKYTAFNSHHDYMNGKVRSYYWTNWSLYCLAKRSNSSLKPEDFRVQYELKFSRLPGQENILISKIKDYFNANLCF
jgi:hypothetical protein